MSIPIRTADGPYAVAIAELPLSAHRSEDPTGAVVVVEARSGWGEKLVEAAAQGACGLVVRDPQAGASGDLAAANATPPALPVVVDRPLLRGDLVDDVRRGGTRAPAMVQVECSGSGADFATVARDAFGWARVLAGGPLVLVSAQPTSRGFSALLTWPGDDIAAVVPVAVLATRRAGTAPWIRAIALGADRTEVTIDVARGSAVVERTSEAGRVIHPTRWESAERSVLRRALEALDEFSGQSELADLQLDTTLSAQADQGLLLG
jgi:hypothetical protein